MRIGIITIHGADNYGSVLQSYATQELLTALGQDAVILNYVCPKIHNEYGISRILSQPGFVKKAEAAVRVAYLRRARKNFASFRKQYYHMAEFCREAQENFDFYLAGSDQVWNYRITGFDKTYFLDFVKDPAKKISYASSFGLSEIDEEYRSEYAALLKDFASISVREIEGAEIVRQLAGRDAAVVLDPVFMVPRKQWEAVSVLPDETGYILLYYIAYSQSLMDFAQALSRKTGKKIISIQGSLRRRIQAKYVWNAGPAEFLGLIRNADFIITNSFHGTACSILFHKRFFVEMLPSFEKTNSRLQSVLKLFRLEEREIVEGKAACGEQELDGTAVEQRLAQYQKEALDYLNTAFGSRSIHES